MIPRLSNRTPRTRAVGGNMGQPRLESLAAEFALLAQRRSRAVHQIEILDQQRAAAAVGFAKLQKRIAWLMDRMDTLGPDLRDPPRPVAPALPQIASNALAAPNALAAIGRQWVAAQPTLHDRPIPPKRT